MADHHDQVAEAAVEKAAADPRDPASFTLISEPRASTRDNLVMMADEDELGHNAVGETFARIKVDNHVECYRIRSQEYKDHIINKFAHHPVFMREVGGKKRPATASKQAVDEALCCIDAMARMPGTLESEAALRSVLYGDGLYIDLGDPKWRSIEVRPDGWRVLDQSPVPILRSRKAGSLPMPDGPGDLSALRQVMPQMDDRDFMLLVCWIVVSLWPRRPYLILGLAGEQGAGKSTLSRMVRRLVDPSAGEVLQPPTNERDLVAAARHSYVLAFDNISFLSAELADGLCRLATGAQLGGRALFSDFDVASFDAARPIIMNGIPDLANRGDLASRTIGITLQPLAQNRTEAELWEAFEAAGPKAMAAILDGLVLVTRNLKATSVPQGLRMADCARIAAAAAPAFGWTSAQGVSALKANANSLAEVLIEGDVLADAVVRYMEREHSFAGSATELLKALDALMFAGDRRPKEWPSNGKRLSELLRRMAPALRSAHGIDFVAYKSNGKRLIRLSQWALRQASEACAPASLSAPDALDPDAQTWPDRGAQGRRDGAAEGSLDPSEGVGAWEDEL